MPYQIRSDHPDCSGFAVVGPNGKVAGCHKTKPDAMRQMRALYANVGDAMNENQIGLVAVTADQINAEGVSWIEVLPTAEKVRNGPYYWTVNLDDLKAAAAYIEANPDKLPVDRDHEGARDDGSSRAAGWFTGQAKVVQAGEEDPRGETQDHDSLWGEVKWTPTAVQEIRDGEFRFVSAEFGFDKKDPKTGLMTKLKELAAATLTNRPFHKELAPVTASELSDEDLAAVLAERMSLDPGVFFEKLNELRAVPAGAVEQPKEPTTEGEEMSPDILKALDLPETADDAAVLAKINELKSTLTATTGLESDALQVFQALAKEGITTAAELNELKIQMAKKSHDEDRERYLARAVEEGRLVPSMKAAVAAIYDVDPSKAKALVESTPPRSFREIGSGAPDPGAPPERRVIADKKGGTVAVLNDPDWLHEQAVRKLSAKGISLKNATPDQYRDAIAEADQDAR